MNRVERRVMIVHRYFAKEVVHESITIYGNENF